MDLRPLALAPVLLVACQAPPRETPHEATSPDLAAVRTPEPTAEEQELADLSALAAELRAGTGLPALSLAVVVDGELAGHGADGLRRVGSTEEVTADDRFHIGSCTKSMTATLAAICVEDGLLTWDTTVGEVFPELGAGDGIELDLDLTTATLEELLTNTAGLPTAVEPTLWAELWAEADEPTAMRRRLLEGSLARPLERAPGAAFQYSNTGFAIAGHMLEERAGVPWEQLMRTRLFDPLAMTTAGFRAPAAGAGVVDQPYGHVLQGDALAPVEPEPAGDNPRAIAPAGAVHLSALDLARYVRLHLGADDAGLLTDASRERLHAAPGGAGTDFYAKGWFLAPRGWADGVALFHAGSNTMWYAVIWAAPERGFAAIAMTNVSGEEAPGACDAAVARLIEDFLGPLP